MEKIQVNAIIERAKDGTFSIYTDNDKLPYTITGTGKTLEEAKQVFLGGYNDTREYFKSEGKRFQEAQFAYVYDFASFLAYYTQVFSLAGLSHLTGINPQQLSHYATGRRNPSAKTMQRIDTALHSFSQDLASFSFVHA